MKRKRDHPVLSQIFEKVFIREFRELTRTSVSLDRISPIFNHRWTQINTDVRHQWEQRHAVSAGLGLQRVGYCIDLSLVTSAPTGWGIEIGAARQRRPYQRLKLVERSPSPRSSPPRRGRNCFRVFENLPDLGYEAGPATVSFKISSGFIFTASGKSGSP